MRKCALLCIGSQRTTTINWKDYYYEKSQRTTTMNSNYYYYEKSQRTTAMNSKDYYYELKGLLLWTLKVRELRYKTEKKASCRSMSWASLTLKKPKGTSVHDRSKRLLHDLLKQLLYESSWLSKSGLKSMLKSELKSGPKQGPKSGPKSRLNTRPAPHYSIQSFFIQN